jgi:polysaccharide export outer membrane protein
MVVTLLLGFVALLAAQTPPQVAVPAPAPTQVSPGYEVGPSDVLNIKVFNEPDLSGPFSVDSDGTITFPFLGRVTVGGKTVRDIEAQLTKALTGAYLRNPQISVEIGNYRSRAIFILGAVKQPGKYSIEGPMTLLEVLARAGSLTADAGNTIIVQRYKDGLAAAVSNEPMLPGDPRGAEVMRVNVSDLNEGRLNANILLQDSDTIVVPAADRFYVTGFVRQPGSFVLRPGMSVQQAIAEAGGFTERGSTRGIKIVRQVNGKEIEINVKMSDPVKPNDTIRVRQRLI